ncbi:TonB-dependent receptor [Synoicihabitans lomoniglobus]|uniref:TonB-dependent receptor n=1 Tax=Synoicihabitans lomoniglobus TaxID=2909285 RepID=A0AAE9ZW07_9BACT|nr:TonB-dependent receptor [Opitutaceae bacterium LMO-M01]WED63518.1 TonB-dependent receptor [Opitutaceae bacterium LMO-M01]
MQRLPGVAVTSTTCNPSEDFAAVDLSTGEVVLPPSTSLDEALSAIPAVTFSRRGANNAEPVIRGFSFDRISTLYNGLPLLNASPTRTAAPVNFFRSGLVGQVRVQRSLPSVTSGPITTGGQLEITSFPTLPLHRSPPAEPATTLSVRTYGNQHGLALGASTTGQSERVRYRIGGQYVKIGDYTSGDGRRVDADHEGWGESAALLLDLTTHHTTEIALHHCHQALDRNISLPFDTVDTDFYAATLNHTWQRDDQTLRFRVGYTETHPYLSTAARPSEDDATVTAPATPTPGPGGPGGPGGLGGPATAPPARPLNTDLHGDAIAYATGLSWQTMWSQSFTTTVGTDATWSTRDVARDRLLSDNSINIDRLWPDVLTRDLGLFGELAWQNEATRFRLGTRLDRVHRAARAADASIIGIAGARGETIRQNYVGFNGPAAGITTHDHTTGAANVTIAHDLTSAWTARLGLGVTRMAPTPTEAYRAFLSNPSGVADLGNPALEPETKKEIEAGLRYASDDLRFSAQVFYAHIDDYIQRRRILITPTQVFSFRNADARFYGGEAALAWTPTAAPGWSLTATAASVRGEDLTTAIDQAGLPPWNATVTTRYQHTLGERLLWIALETAHTAGKVNPNPTEAALFRDTTSYTLLGLRLGARVTKQLTLEVAVENLLDETYYRYLTAPAATAPSGPSGSPAPAIAPDTLAPGDSVPGVGRSINLSARWSF